MNVLLRSHVDTSAESSSLIFVGSSGTSTVNGRYTLRGTHNTKSFYNKEGAADNPVLNSISWNSGTAKWEIWDTGSLGLCYTSTDAVTYPWQVTTWTVVGGSATLPVVTGSFGLSVGLHTVSRSDLHLYETFILASEMSFPLPINQFEGLNQQFNEQIYNLYQSDEAIASGSGFVTSVDATVPSGLLAVSGNPITGVGTLAFSLVNQTVNKGFFGPATGSPAPPTFRTLVVADIPSLTSLYQPLDTTLTNLAANNWAANSVPIGSGTDTIAQINFGANTFPARASTGNLVAKTITDFGLSLVDDVDLFAARSTLGFAGYYLLSDYGGSLSTAITAIEAAISTTPTELKINVPCSIVADYDHSAHSQIVLTMENTGRFTVSSGKRLTIGSFTRATGRQWFFGSGDVVFARNAVNEFDFSWWVGIGSSAANVNHEFSQLCTSITNSYGGIAYVGAGVWKINAQALPNGSRLKCAGGQSTFGTNCTTFQIPSGVNNTNIFNITDGYRNMSIENCVLDCGPSTGSTAFYLHGTQISSGWGVRLQGVNALNGQHFIWADDYDYGSGHATGWEIEGISVIQCTAAGQTVAAVRCDTINGSWLFDQNEFSMNSGVDHFLLNHVGMFTSRQTTLVGGGGSSACYRITGTHNPINIYDSQDEGVPNFLVTSAFYNQCSINVHGSVIQSKSILNGAPNVHFIGCTHFSNSVVSTASNATPRVTNTKSLVQTLDLTGATVARNLCVFAGSPPGGILVEEDIILTDQNTRKIFRAPTKIFSPPINDGNASVPILELGYNTGTSESKVLLRAGRYTSGEAFEYGVTWLRDYTTGRFAWNYSQTAFLPRTTGEDYNGDLTAYNFTGAVVRNTLTANVNDFATTISAFDIPKLTYILTCANDYSISGLFADYIEYSIDGMHRWIINGNAAGGKNITLLHQNTGSRTTNRLINSTGADVVLKPGDMAIAILDVPSVSGSNNATTSRWHVWTSPNYTDEQAQDAIGLMVDSSLIYTDATPQLSRAALTGDVTASQGGNATTIANLAITNAKIANTTIDLTAKVTGLLPVANAGTNMSSYTQGDLIYASASGTLSKLVDVATGNALISGGVGLAPSYGKIALTTHVSGQLPLANLTDMATASLYYRKTAGTGSPEVNSLATLKTDLGLTGTNSGDQTITLTGDVTGTGTGSFAATIANLAITNAKIANTTIDLTAKVTGLLPVANAGTNISSYTQGDLIYASASGTLSKLNDVATGNVLISGGTGLAPTYGKVGLTTHVSGSLPIANGGTAGTDLATAKANLGISRTLFNNFADIANAFASARETLFNYTLPAGTFTTNGDSIELIYTGVTANNSNAKYWFASFGGTTIFNSLTEFNGVQSNSVSWRIDTIIMRVSGTVIRYSMRLDTYDPVTGDTTPFVKTGELTGLTLSSTNAMVLDCQAGAAGDITAKMARGVYMPGI